MDAVTLQDAAHLAAAEFSLWSLFLRADIVVQAVMVGLISHRSGAGPSLSKKSMLEARAPRGRCF